MAGKSARRILVRPRESVTVGTEPASMARAMVRAEDPHRRLAALTDMLASLGIKIIIAHSGQSCIMPGSAVVVC
jgi:hypothetical protein